MRKLTLASILFCALVFSAKAQGKMPSPEVNALLTKYTCYSCHKISDKLIGPSYEDIMKKKKYSVKKIVALIAKPEPKNWPDYPPMAPLPNVTKADATKIATWMQSLK